MPAVFQALLAENEGTGTGTGGGLSDASLDAMFGAVRGTIIARAVAGWVGRVPSAAGQVVRFDGLDTDFENPYFFGSSPPALPIPGYRWLDSVNGIMFTWVDDSTSTQWIEL